MAHYWLIVLMFAFQCSIWINGEATEECTEDAYCAKQFCCPSSRISNFEKYGIIPDVLSSYPKYITDVTYYNEEYVYAYVCLGNIISSDLTKNQPFVSWPAVSNTYYTLVMYGSLASFDHWIVGNILGCDVSKGEELSGYFMPIPPPGSGPQDYTYAVFVQKCKSDFAGEPRIPSGDPIGRPLFNLTRFIEKYDLKLWSANFHRDITTLTSGLPI